jgi:hypothetical protein
MGKWDIIPNLRLSGKFAEATNPARSKLASKVESECTSSSSRFTFLRGITED